MIGPYTIRTGDTIFISGIEKIEWMRRLYVPFLAANSPTIVKPARRLTLQELSGHNRIFPKRQEKMADSNPHREDISC